MIRAAATLLRALPVALERGHLRWALAELQRWNPMHPDLPFVVRRIRELEAR